VDFKEQEIDFREADRRYSDLKRQRAAGTITDEEFEAQRQRLMVLDSEGRWWAKSRETGEWRYHDGSTWIPGTPPGYQEDIPDTARPQAPAPSPPEDTVAPRRRRRVPLWIPVVGFGGLALIGIVVVVWVLVPSLRDAIMPGEQGASVQDKEGANAQSESASEGIAFDAVFVHHANPDNISANSTYLDNPLTNGHPNAILYVTQNWNPGGSIGIYNNHPIGVWYDPDRERWAIFNQDREAIPKGADFNVGVIKEAQKE
jgi:hypothetical protein